MEETAGALLDRAIAVLAANWLALAVLVASGVLARLHVAARASRVTRLFAWPVWLGALVAALASLACSAFVFLLRGEPVPATADDVAHLLVADTLLHGRLANPPHPFCRHLLTVLALDHPKYASLYAPGNGVVLAIGRILVALPIAGVWLSSAGAAAATVWAARAWLPRAWCVLAGLIIAVHPTVTLWNTVYYSGSLPLLGGALLLGAAGRLARRPTPGVACVAAIALAVLANTRQWEGLFLALAMAPLVLIANRRAIPAMLRVSAPAFAILLLGAIATGIYNRAVTGNALLVPHLLYDRLYQTGPNFLWQGPKTHAPFPNEEAYLASRPYVSFHARLNAPGGVRRMTVDKLLLMIDAVAAPEASPPVLRTGRLLLALPLLFVPALVRRPRGLALVAALAVFLFAPLTTTWWLSRHYVAPAGALVLILYLVLAHRASAAARGRGAFLTVCAIVVLFGCSADFLMRTAQSAQRGRAVERAGIQRALERGGGQHLILVPPSIPFTAYNGADLENAPVLWARQLDPASDAALLRHYARRHVWRLGVREGRLALRPYR